MLKQPLRMPKQLAAQGLVEYGFIITFIALACVAGLTLLGTTTNDFLKSVHIP